MLYWAQENHDSITRNPQPERIAAMKQSPRVPGAGPWMQVLFAWNFPASLRTTV